MAKIKPKRLTAIAVLLLISSVVVVLASPTFQQLFTGYIGEGPTVNYTVTAYDLGTVFPSASYNMRVPSSGYSFTTNDYSGNLNVTMILGEASGNFTSFKVEVWLKAVIGEDTLKGSVDMSTMMVQFAVGTSQDYYYRMIFDVGSGASTGKSFTVKIRLDFS